MVRPLAAALLLSLAGLCIPPGLWAQEERIRAPLWVYAEGVPGSGQSGTGPFETGEDDTARGTGSPSGPKNPADDLPPLAQLQELARFVLSGMIYGWRYDYYPSDRLRGVAEEFTLKPIAEISKDDPSFSLTGLTAAYPRLSCWAQYVPNETTARWERHWASVTAKNASGRGSGERIDGAAGIRTAYEKALLNAVREHARKLEKNKPKQVSGQILLRSEPRLFPDAGRFTADIRVVLTIDELVPWRVF